MSLTNDQLLVRITALEKQLNKVQEALNNVPTKSQVKHLSAVRQEEINELRVDMNQFVETGISPGLTEHTNDTDPHSVYLNTTRHGMVLGNPHALTRADIGAASAAEFTTHSGNLTIHFTEASIDHSNILNIGINTHEDIDEFISSKGTISGIAELDAFGKVPNAQLPALAITDTFVTTSYAEMLTLDASTGDVSVRTDENKSYILTDTDPTVSGNWQELLTPPNMVTSVHGRTGNVIAVNNDYTWAQVDKSTSSILDITTRLHSSLQNLTSDDHTQYLLTDGTRSLSGNLSVGGNSLTGINELQPTGSGGYLDLSSGTDGRMTLRNAGNSASTSFTVSTSPAGITISQQVYSTDFSILSGSIKKVTFTSSGFLGSEFVMSSDSTITWASGTNIIGSSLSTAIRQTASGKIRIDTGSVGALIDVSTADTFRLRNLIDSAFASLLVGSITSSSSIISPYFSTTAANLATTGAIRFGNTEGLYWRNAANTANLSMTVDASDIMQIPSTLGWTFNGSFGVNGTVYLANATTIAFGSRSYLTANNVASSFRFGSISGTSGFILDAGTTDTLTVKNFANTANAALRSGTITTGAEASGSTPPCHIITRVDTNADAPTSFDSHHFVIGRSALTDTSSGAIFFGYNSSTGFGYFGALSPGVSWRPIMWNNDAPAGIGDVWVGRNVAFKWNDALGNGTPSTTLGIKKNATGVLEINNGTAGTYRDLIARNTTLTGNVLIGTSASQVIDGGNLVSIRGNASIASGNAYFVASDSGGTTIGYFGTVSGSSFMGTYSNHSFGVRTNNNTRISVAAAGDITISTPIDMTTTTGTLRLPRLDTTQRNALTPLAGMVIFNTTDSKMQCYDGSTWQNAW